MKNIKVSLFLTVSILITFAHSIFGQMKTDNFEFKFNGNKLTGFLDLPEGRDPSAIVILVPGYGKTNFSEHNWYYDSLRSNFTQLGIACCEWDKAGCGKSEGAFDINQPVQSSAKEVLAAIEELKRRNISGSDKIGLWGISRAGWICPLVIEAIPSIAFWISVSGTDDKENFGYLLESNLQIEGRSESEAKLLVSEWQRGNEVFRNGRSFEEYLKAIQNIRKDSFCVSYFGYGKENKEDYLRNQNKFINEQHHDEYDKETGLMIYVPNFRETLMKINCPVLSISGEKDCNVDWKKTIALYKETIGSNKNADLTIKTLPDCNHSIIKCKTGGIHESINKWEYGDGYLETIRTWLIGNRLGIKN
jgi:dipeptidyl aminopeptidase/acylaminoacyl peptidase